MKKARVWKIGLLMTRMWSRNEVSTYICCFEDATTSFTLCKELEQFVQLLNVRWYPRVNFALCIQYYSHTKNYNNNKSIHTSRMYADHGKSVRVYCIVLLMYWYFCSVHLFGAIFSDKHHEWNEFWFYNEKTHI